MIEKYYLGLDMGTNSVGWAVTDSEYHLLRKKGKDLWGVREFEEAHTAAERRLQRISRRGRQKECVRIGLLKTFFADAIDSVDPNFYARLENSKYHLEDKDEPVSTPNSIFADNDYTDKEYFAEFPTIFHLRSELIHNPEPHDVRLVFLALLNMFKHRGHFLNLGSISEDSKGMQEAYANLIAILNEVLEINFELVDCKEIEYILSNRDYSRTEKAEKFAELLHIQKSQKREFAIIKTICGLKGDAKIIFNLENLIQKVEIEFSSFGYEDKAAEIQASIGAELFDVVCAMKAVYDIGSLAGILRGNVFLSDVRIEDYNKHGKDLKVLKDFIRKHCSQEDYDRMFRSEEAGSYSAYVNSVSYDKLYKTGEHSKHRRNMNDRQRDKFYASVKKLVINVITEDAQKQYILNEIEKETFMPKQLTASNGVIPNQVHEREMVAILRNAKEYLPFLNEIDESGLSVGNRILKLFTFQIPYYIGPVSENSKKYGGNGWVIRKEAGKVLPWNWKDKIDEKKTAEQFISNMVRKCTYISGEQVLPKYSLLYEKYCVLNEINNIKIDNERISVEIKQDIFNELFMQKNKVTKEQLAKYLINRGLIQEECQISGIDKTINSSLDSYRKFKAILGDEIDTDSGREKAEKIIFWCTVYGDSKAFLIANIKENYPEMSEYQIKRIIGIKFKGWGRFSREFLHLKGTDIETYETKSIIQALWESQCNLMELLHSDRYSFKAELEAKQKEMFSSLIEVTPDALDGFYFSAPVKKMIWQTLCIIRELIEILGQAPEKVFIEMTRSDEEKGDKGRKDSRKKQLLELYKKINDDSQDWKELIETSDSDGRIKSKKMYLYLTQMGKDMYTGEKIDLDNLFNDNIYDIDHIYPRHFVKDDSIHNNLVLVRRETNAHKSDEYPLKSSIRQNKKVRDHWTVLRNQQLITEEKYRRLIGSKEFTDEQKADFIARQIVETGQATKGIADILKQVLPGKEIVYVKASNVSEFRKKYKLLKSRTVNDFHHANDAYLNIVVGNVYLAKFTKNPINFIREEYQTDRKKNNYNLDKMFDRDVVRNGETAWIAAKKNGTSGTIGIVKTMMSKNTPLITKALVEEDGQLFNTKPLGKNNAKDSNYVPLKRMDEKLGQLNKYGGYTSLKPSYFMIVEHGKPGKRKIIFVSVPVIMRKQLVTEAEKQSYCAEKLKLVNPEIINGKVKIYSLLKIDGYYVRIVGMDSRGNIELHNAVSMCLNREIVNYLVHVENVVKAGSVNKEICSTKNCEIYNSLIDKHANSIYSKRPKVLVEGLKKKKEAFINCEDLLEQCKLLIKALELTKLGACSGEESRMRISGNITGKREVLLVNQSVTGVYENINRII